MHMRPSLARVLIPVLLLAFAMMSCAPKKVLHSTPSGGQTGQKALPGHKSADPDKALEKYTRHLAATKPGDPGRDKAWQTTVNSAVQIGEYDLAEKNLRAWQAENSTAPKSWDWNQANAQLLLAKKGADAYAAYLTKLMGRKDLDWSTREAAGMDLFYHFWDLLEYGLAFDSLGILYKEAPDTEAKAALESFALSKAETLEQEEMDKTVTESMGADPAAFPWAMVFWAQGMQRLEEDKAAWPIVWPTLSNIVRSGKLANQAFFAGNLRNLEKEMGVSAQSLVLLLPLTGPYSKVGWQVAKGADCAWRETRTGTGSSDIRLINTEAANFLDELKTVDGSAIVGGPLRKEVWERIRMAGLNRSAKYLTFLPNVEEEGVAAWRFFSSPSDQARVLLQACTTMGVTSYVVLHPQDRFGTAMATVFQDEAKAKGLQVSTVRGYDIANPPVWTKAVADVLGTSVSAKDGMNAEPPFQAVFMPDSLSRVQQLASLFHYYEENRIFFLGPQLWSQSVGESQLEMQYFGLTIFPGAWNPGGTSQAVLNLKKGMNESGAGDADLWAALGYDFARFAPLLNAGGDASAFNQSLTQAASRMAWSMAPLRWDAAGKANQDLFIFQPTPSGMIEADLNALQKNREERQLRREEQKQQLHNKKQ